MPTNPNEITAATPPSVALPAFLRHCRSQGCSVYLGLGDFDVSNDVVHEAYGEVLAVDDRVVALYEPAWQRIRVYNLTDVVESMEA